MDWDQFHASRSFRCSLAPLPLPLPSALTLKASIPCTIFPLHPLLFSGSSLATSLGDILMDIRIILICIERHPRFSLHQWRLETQHITEKKTKKTTKCSERRYHIRSRSYTLRFDAFCRHGGISALEAKAANGDFTDNAAARVHTSRGMPKMQPSTSSRSKTIAAGICPRQTLRAVG